MTQPEPPPCNGQPHTIELHGRHPGCAIYRCTTCGEWIIVPDNDTQPSRLPDNTHIY